MEQSEKDQLYFLYNERQNHYAVLLERGQKYLLSFCEYLKKNMNVVAIVIADNKTESTALLHGAELKTILEVDSKAKNGYLVTYLISRDLNGKIITNPSLYSTKFDAEGNIDGGSQTYFIHFLNIIKGVDSSNLRFTLQ